MKRIGIGLLVGLSLFGAVLPAAAHHRSKIRGPFGTWTWGPMLPHESDDTGGQSCLAVVQERAKEITIHNGTGLILRNVKYGGRRFGPMKPNFVYSFKPYVASTSDCGWRTYRFKSFSIDSTIGDGRVTYQKIHSKYTGKTRSIFLYKNADNSIYFNRRDH